MHEFFLFAVPLVSMDSCVFVMYLFDASPLYSNAETCVIAFARWFGRHSSEKRPYLGAAR